MMADREQNLTMPKLKTCLNRKQTALTAIIIQKEKRSWVH